MKKIACVLGLGLVAPSLLAQVPCFDTNYGTAIGNGDDSVLPLQPIGFAFPFGGATYTDVYVSTNGFVYLTNGPAASTPSALCCAGTSATLLANTVGPMICPFWTDLNLTAANNAQVHVNSNPAICTITWFNAIEYGDAANTKFHMQLKLWANGQVDATYTTNMLLRTAGDCMIGVSPGNGATDPGAVDLSAGGASTGDTVYEIFDNAARPFDLAGQTLTLVSTGPGTPGSPFVYTVTTCPGAVPPASNETFGQGCVRSFNSLYENFTTSAAFDLQNSSMTLLSTGTGYLATPGTATYIAPTPTATVLALTDDSQTSVTLSAPFPYAGGTTTSLTVCSNGYVSVASGNGTGFSPSVTTFLNAPQTGWWNWHDLNPAAAGSGQVKFEEVGGVAYVTYDGVYNFSGTTAADANTFQFQFELATGNVNIVWTTTSTGGNGRLVGYSPGGNSQDPGSTDLSVALPAGIVIPGGPELVPLGLTASGTASPGGTVTLTTTNIPAGSPFGFVILGTNMFNPGVPLDAIGMPGCFQYTTAVATNLFFAPGTGTTFTAPTGTTFLGASVTAQSAAYAPGTTPLGFVSSNGVRLTLGT